MTNQSQPDHSDTQASIRSLRQLRMVGWIEGTTLLLLLGVAMPLKRLAGIPDAVTVMGPVHGLSFLLYAWAVIRVVSGEDWPRREAVRLCVAALLPFGTFLNEGLLRRKLMALQSGGQATS